MKTIEFPLLSTRLTEKDSKHIMAPILHAGLKRSGICSTISRDLVYSPTKYQGLGLPNPLITQGIKKLYFLIDVYGQPNLGGNTVIQSIEQTQLEIGTSKPFYHLNFKRFKKANTPSLLTYLWEFLSQYDIFIDGPLPSLKIMRKNDRLIMDLLYENSSISRDDLAACNRVRLYLRVTNLAEITTADGRSLRKDCL